MSHVLVVGEWVSLANQADDRHARENQSIVGARSTVVQHQKQTRLVRRAAVLFIINRIIYRCRLARVVRSAHTTNDNNEPPLHHMSSAQPREWPFEEGRSAIVHGSWLAKSKKNADR